ncbi:hypothetical protein [Nocardioides mesophilus]|uniref:Uncharacterized protein n=1 Tax=Nocardioides mesophilus TaxID=433659 RepID=A0A7G9RA54_9ACTN|nr:hypothetical protein [Nocardioides mesophilus]QNN52479.1 hypothetical protein H9L09_18720 [Nocardioides mesophilus]
MHFTEYELTAAVTGAAKGVLASKKRRRRGTDVDAEWDAMDRYQRFKLLDAVGSQVLPVLVALPDVPVAPGTRPSYSHQQIQEVVRGLVGDDIGKMQRLVVVKARTALVQTALTHVPPRSTEPGTPASSPGPAPGR